MELEHIQIFVNLSKREMKEGIGQDKTKERNKGRMTTLK
jgi:hypothetical protein